MRSFVFVLAAALVFACGTPPSIDDGVSRTDDRADASVEQDDAGAEPKDAGNEPPDGSVVDEDAGVVDSGTPPADAGSTDGGAADAGGKIDAGTVDAGTPPTTALLRPSNPLTCADPAVFSQNGAGQVFFVYCTSMSHVWKTSDWVHFSDVRSSVTFTMTGLSANGQKIGSWWAPGIVYSPVLQQYVMWVSVPDSQATNTTSGWDMRSMAVFTATSPTGPWTFQAIALDASATDQHYIDPFLFIDHDGSRYVYWKQYGGGLSSSIVGAKVNASWTAINATTRTVIMNGYGGPGTWEDNVRENPAVWYNPADGRHHMLFSGGHWFNDTYATGHALSSCGPLCPPATTGGWHMVDSGDRNILQVVRSVGNANFANGGPGGAVFLDDSAQDIIYAAAARSANGVTTRYLMKDHVEWQNRAPFVDTAGHEPLGY